VILTEEAEAASNLLSIAVSVGQDEEVLEAEITFVRFHPFFGLMTKFTTVA
jgi:hypothetical protein